MKWLKVVGDLSLIFLCIAAVIIDAIFIYMRYIDPSQTIGINIIGNQVGIDSIDYEKDMTESEKEEFESRMLFEINLLDNENKNGIWLGEMQMNYFTTPALTVKSYRSSGTQLGLNFHNDFLNNTVKSYFDMFKIPMNSNDGIEEMYFKNNYETTDFVTWNGNEHIVTGLKENKEYIVKIDNSAYSINLNGKFKTSEPLWGFLWNVEKEYAYTFNDLFFMLISAAANTEIGEGTCYLTPDLSQFFEIKKFDENGILQPQVYTDIVKNYATIKVNYSKNGAHNSSQSLFKLINNNPNFDLYETNLDTDYWQSSVTYNLNEKHLDKRFSEKYNGHLLSLSQDLIKDFNDMPRTKINLNINLSSAFFKDNNINALGFDFDAFKNIKINSITLLSDNSINFYMLDNCLDNSLKEFKHSSNINFIWSNSASFPTDCKVVVL